MKKISLLILLLSLFSFFGCEDDIIGEGDSIEIIQEPSLTISSSVTGIVTNILGEPMVGVTISYNNKDYQTDENGFFKINDVIASEDGGILFFEKDGYFRNFKFFIPQASAKSFMRVHMIERNLSGSVSGSNGGLIEINGGAKIEFPASAFVDENNVSYEGEVSVYAHWFDPASAQFSPSMPGDLRAVTLEGELAQLSTFGMMAVELRSTNNKKLNLAEGKKAKLDFPIPNALLNNAPDVIQTWSLDEKTVYWIEEDIAFLENGRYIAEVSHFSFWNCDAPFPLVNIFGKLVNQSGEAIPGYRICIIAFNGAQTGYGWTDNLGGFRGKVPKNQELVMQIKDECGNIVFDETIGPFSSDASFGEITVNVSKSVVVKGYLVCNGMPISTGYARIQINNAAYYIAEVDDNGYFELPIIQCQINEITVQGFDLENARISEIQTYNVNGQAVLEVGNLEVCQALDEYIIYKINNSQQLLIENPSAKIVDGKLIIGSFVDSIESGVRLIAPNAVVSTNGDVTTLYASLWDPLNNFFEYICDDDACENTIINITGIGGEGDYVMGDFMGQEAGSTSSSTVMGSFRIQIDYVGDSKSISGVTWIDINQDGIRQSTEPLLQNAKVSLSSLESSENYSRETDANGYYLIDNLCPGTYYLRITSSNGFAYTLQNQGSDDTIDSDLSPQGLTIVIEDQNLENLDCGFQSNGSVGCEIRYLSTPSCVNPQGGSFALFMSGVSPYIINLDGVEIATTNDSEYIVDNLSEGGYFLEVFDAIGSSCSRDIGMNESDSLFCDIVTSPQSCGDQNGTAFVEVFGEGTDYTFQWSTGETTQGITDLVTGDYSVTITSAEGCVTTCEGFVFQEPLIVEISSDLIGCDNGVNEYLLVAEVFGNFNNLDFLWSDGQFGPSIIINDGSFEIGVLVIDLDGNCSAEAEISLDPGSSNISGIVWVEDENGTPDVYDEGLEVGRDSIIVELYRSSNLNTPYRTTGTDSEGNYTFFQIPTGDYLIRVLPFDIYEFVIQDAGTNDSVDSDVDPSSGFTDVFQHDGCVDIDNIYAGLLEN